MATVKPMMPDGKKLSFAKVAASGAKDNMVSRVAVPVSIKSSQEPHVPRPVIPLAPVPAAAMATLASKAPPNHQSRPPTSHPTQVQAPKTLIPSLNDVSKEVDNDLADNVKNMKVEHQTPNLVVNGTCPTVMDQAGKNLILSKDGSGSIEEKTDSNSDLGTKPPSHDDKSVASATTFALDEKESLRPDDSASMKATADDDDTFSNRGSILTGRVGSETKAVRIQIGDVTLNTTRQIPVVQEIRAEQDSQTQQMTQPALQEDGQVNAINNALYGQNPDEKLLEAMNSPKDRIFLLRLEKDVIDFVQNSKEPFIDLPPCNSFCRLLTHKLADYYHMTHSYETNTSGAGSVRIFRTPFCRVPPSLASIVSANTPKNATPPPVILPKKIMRRGEDGNGSTAPPSADASKATSEAGSDKDRPIAKERLTREEREEAYNRARERIFGTIDKTGESTPENEDSTGISRASSVSTKDKAMIKRKPKRRDDNDGFETRSQYAAYYSHPHQPWQPQFVPINSLSNVGQQPYSMQMQPPQQLQQPQQPQHPFNSQVGSLYMSSPPQYQQGPANNGYSYNPNGPSYAMSQPMQQSFSQPITMNRGPSMQSYSQPGISGPVASAPMPTTPQQTWQQPYTGNQGPFPYRSPQIPPSVPSTSAPASAASGIPYAFGQLPANANPHDPKSQHPIPGSYNRQHSFNPKTQSFVPGINQGYAQGPIPHGSPQIQSAPMFNGPYGPQQQYAGGFGMARQPSSSGMPPPPFQPQSHMPPPAPAASQPVSNPPHLPNKPQAPQGGHIGTSAANASPKFPHLPNYGNPATLPQKPPNPQRPGL